MIQRTFKRALTFTTATLIGLFLLLPTGPDRPVSVLLPTAEAGFFSNDLELFEEVVNLVRDKYVYPPDFKKMFTVAINEMVRSVNEESIVVTDTPEGQSISRADSNIHYQLSFNWNQNLKAFKKVYYFLLEESGGKLSKEGLETAAVTGLMSSLDPYSQYMDEDTLNRSMQDTEGKYGGLGMVITMKDNRLYVVKTMKNSPAQRAGILPDDAFVKVNGKKVKETQIAELADMLRGYPNTKVTVSLYRKTDDREHTYVLTREIISIETVEYKPLKDHVGLIKISSFSKQTHDQLRDALTKAKRDGAKEFILDLRDNPGGLLEQSVKVASHFLLRNRLVVYTQGREKSDYKEYRAKYKNTLHSIPVVVLINQNSASASEIVAGALRDSGKALVIGENSYGKGSVQTIFRTSSGSGLRLTTSKYYTPSGTDITEQGITPEIRVLKDPIPEELKSSGNSKTTPLKDNPSSPIQLKESEILNFIKENGQEVAGADDPTLQFAQILIKGVSVANKKQTLKKARELAANIHY